MIDRFFDMQPWKFTLGVIAGAASLWVVVFAITGDFVVSILAVAIAGNSCTILVLALVMRSLR